MKMATARGPKRLMRHTDRCQGDGHGMFTATTELATTELPGLWTRLTCTHCGSTSLRNSKGERHDEGR